MEHDNILEYTEHFRAYTDLGNQLGCDKCGLNYIDIHIQSFPAQDVVMINVGLAQGHPKYVLNSK